MYGLRYERGVIVFTRKNRTSCVTVAVNCGPESAILNANKETHEITRGIKLSKITLNTYDFSIFSEEGIKDGNGI